MTRRTFALLGAAALLIGQAGCSTDTELGGVRIPNSRPDTRITGQPPTLLEAGFAATFNWTGSDPDGKVVGFEWKISDNGLDGISARDTLTQDPLTGAVLNPWRYTTANDSTFFVLADQAGFPGDPVAGPRSFRSHSLFIRAVDDKGAKDPSPAYISFTSTTIVPTCRVVFPNLSTSSAKTVPPTVNIGWEGLDSDFDLRIPTKVRFLWKEAIDENGNPIMTRNSYLQHADEVLSFDDLDWSPWLPYAALESERKVSFPNQPNGVYFLFAVQVQDTAGAVSVGLGYQQEVGHLWVKTGFYKPQVTLSEPYLGQQTGTNYSYEVAGGQPLNFSWTATAASYNGEVVSYRHGWNLTNPSDPADPGWAVPPGLSDNNLFAAQTSFREGVNTFFLRVDDDSGQFTLYRRVLTVIPYVAREFQKELLVIDQVVDKGVQNWPDQQGYPRNDETYRNVYWRFLAEGSGGVAGLTWERDWRDHTDRVFYSDLVEYKAVLCYAQFNDVSQLMFMEFRPDSQGDNFVWLTPYQERGGNFFLVGASSMESFIQGLSNWAVPIIFDTRETRMFVGNNLELVTGFGTRTLPDDTVVDRGPLQYPYATAGISVLDWTSPSTKYIYGRQSVAKFDRNVDCVGLKGVVLDPAFKANQGIGPGVVADTMFTNPEIDWPDVVAAAADTLNLFTGDFPFRTDEFINANISPRTTSYNEQECDVPEAPGGMCIEPMYTGISRFDWMREYYHRRGETDWPFSRYEPGDLTDGCGTLALTDLGSIPLSSARTNGKTYGFFSYKMVADKPGRRADVYWGFDPYRFDLDESRKAIRWVLQYFGLQINQ